MEFDQKRGGGIVIIINQNTSPYKKRPEEGEFSLKKWSVGGVSAIIEKAWKPGKRRFSSVKQARSTTRKRSKCQGRRDAHSSQVQREECGMGETRKTLPQWKRELQGKNRKPWVT